jgi:DNA-binding transcriptional LysR family regulator
VLDVRRLRLLRELALRGTVAEVAEALHQSPSSVSQQLAVLEREAGTPLLQKAGRRLQLTPQGELLVAHTEAVLARLEEAETDLGRSVGEAAGTVRVAVFQSAALALLPATLHLVTARHPRLRVSVTQREPETALRDTFARDFDLVVAEQYPGHAAPRHAGLDRVPLTEDALRLAVPPGPDWAGVDSLAAAADRPWVMEPRGAASRHFAEQACRTAGFEPDVRYETADLQAHVALIESGHAVAVLPDLMGASRRPEVRTVDLPAGYDGRAPRRTVFTAAPTSMADRPGVRAVRAALAVAAERA